MHKQEELVGEVLKILKKDTRGLTIQELANITGASRITVSFVLMKLELQKKINSRIIGNCKLHYLNIRGRNG